MNLIDRMLHGPKPLLWDGGVGTALISRGLDVQREPPEAWLIHHSDEVRAVHAEFAAAGADVIQTNSFGLLRLFANAQSQKGRPLFADADAAELLQRSVALAQAGAKARKGAPAEVVASIGPAGIAPDDRAGMQRLLARLEEIAAAFFAAGVAGLHLETFYEPSELRQAILGVRRGAPELPLVVSVTVNIGQGGLETPLGVPLSRMLSELEENLPDGIGVNCSLPARRMKRAVAALAAWRLWMHRRKKLAVASLPILAKPQVDQPAPDCKRPPTQETPASFARDLLALRDEDLCDPASLPASFGEKDEGWIASLPLFKKVGGADAIGGCCGCQAVHIAAARAALDGNLAEKRENK